MAVANRAYGKDLSVFNVATGDVVALVADCTIDFGPDTVDGTCLTDPVPTNRPNRDNFNISFTLVDDPTSTTLSNAVASVGSVIGFICTSSSGGITYECTNALLQKATHQIPDGGQTIRFDLVAHGHALTITP